MSSPTEGNQRKKKENKNKMVGLNKNASIVSLNAHPHAQSLQSCPTLRNPMACPLGYSALGIFQARILEWVVIPSSRRSS